MVALSEEQKNVIRKVLQNLNNQQIQTIGGYAGVGKSLVVTFLSRVLKNFGIAAYTGKAANVLRTNGIRQASTIHSLIYTAFKESDGSITWMRKSKYDVGVDGFIIDEASMVSEDIHNDLLSFELPIIYVGDHGQLEPIKSKFNIMENPNFKLETIHRNAGEIAYFAEHLRKGGSPQTFKCEQKVQVVHSNSVEDKHLASVEQVICAYNKTRIGLNERIRKHLDINYSYITVGEKIICLRNNKKQGLFNGMQGIIQEVHKKYRIDFTSDGVYYANIRYDPEQFGLEKYDFSSGSEANPFDYGYTISNHRAQGSQFHNVIVFEEPSSLWDNKRWAYTAASRAQKGLIWVSPRIYQPSWL